MSGNFSFSGEVWRYPGAGGWYFVSLPKKISEHIKKANTHPKPWGYVKVRATIGKTSWQTGLWPQAKEGVYLLVIKASVRTKEGIRERDKVRARVELL